MKHLKLFEQFILESNSVGKTDPFLDFRLDLKINELKDGVLYLIYSYSPGGNSSVGFLTKETIKKLQDSYNQGLDYCVFLALCEGDSDSIPKGMDFLQNRLWGYAPEIHLLFELKDDDKYILSGDFEESKSILTSLRSEKTAQGINIGSNKRASAGKFTTDPVDYESMLKKWPYNMMSPEEIKDFRDRMARLEGLTGTMGSINGIPIPNNGIPGVPEIVFMRKEVPMGSSKSYSGENSNRHSLYNIPIKKDYFFGFDSSHQTTGFFLTANEWMRDDEGVSEFLTQENFKAILEEDFSPDETERAFFELVDLGASEETIKNISDALRHNQRSAKRKMTLDLETLKPLFYLWSTGYDDSIRSCPACCKEQNLRESPNSYNKKEVPGHIKRNSDGEILPVGLGYIYTKDGVPWNRAGGYECEVCEESLTPGLISDETPESTKRKIAILMDLHPEWFYGAREIQPFTRVWPEIKKINESDPLNYEMLKKQESYKSVLAEKWKDVTTPDQQQLGIMRFSNDLYAYEIEIDPRQGVSKIFNHKVEKIENSEYLNDLDLKTHTGYNKALYWIAQEIT